jgi:hypothetical protein
MAKSSEEQHEENPHVREARQHMHAAREEWRRTFESILPPGVAEHNRAARREWLLAMRSWVNAAIERMERAEGQPPTNPPSTPAH